MVKSIGGVFLYSENPRVLAEWYAAIFDFTYDYTEKHKAYYISFPYQDIDTAKKCTTVFSILQNSSRPFVDGKFFTLNFRVTDLDKIVATLQAKNIPLTGPETHDEGKFAWFNDPEGNYIELWEDLS